MEAAICTSVIGTKIPCDFTQQQAEGCEELSCTGGWKSGEGAPELCLGGAAVAGERDRKMSKAWETPTSYANSFAISEGEEKGGEGALGSEALLRE